MIIPVTGDKCKVSLRPFRLFFLSWKTKKIVDACTTKPHHRLFGCLRRLSRLAVVVDLLSELVERSALLDGLSSAKSITN